MNRIERRLKAKEDQRLIAGGLNAERLTAVQVMALMRALLELLEESHSAGTVAPLIAFFHRNISSAARPGPSEALACARGCSHCCNSWVSVRAPEALFAKRAIARREIGEVQAAVERAYAVTGTRGVDERAAMSVPCPMLKDRVCRIYAARPTVCRTAVSSDAAICARTFQPGASPEAIPAPDFYIILRRGYSLALAGALKRGGFPTVSYEFNGALRAALAHPDAEAAWLAGEDLFAGVARDPSGDPFKQPANQRLYEGAWM